MVLSRRYAALLQTHSAHMDKMYDALTELHAKALAGTFPKEQLELLAYHYLCMRPCYAHS